MREQVHPVGTTDRRVDQRSRDRLIAVGLARIAGMTNATTTNKSTITKTKTNGTNPEQSAASTSPTSTPAAPAPEKKPLTVMVSESTFRKSKILSQLSGTSLSDLVESQLKAIVKERLPGLLAGLDSEG